MIRWSWLSFFIGSFATSILILIIDWIVTKILKRIRGEE